MQERLSFDAFGKPRNPDGTDAATPITSTQTTRGYTGHKMDAEVGLINMNARLYDPTLGRFISADVTIDAPQDMQTYNRYTYVINNPFAHTDPTGYWSWKNFWKAAKPIVAVAAAAVVTFATGNPVLGGAISGAINGGAKGALMGAVSGALFFGAGEFGAFVGDALGSQLAGVVAGVAANSLAGGAMSVMQGGEFASGFLAGSVAKGLGSIGNGNFGIGGGAGDTFGHMITRVAIAGTIGGLASRAGGGDFWNGFQTGSFSRLFNTELHAKVAFRVPSAIGRFMGWEEGTYSRGASFGLSISFPTGDGAEFDFGATTSGAAGDNFGTGKASIGFGMRPYGSVRSQAGEGGELTVHATPVGASWYVDGDGDVSGASFNIGAGYSAGGHGTTTKVWSVRDGIDWFRNKY